MTMLNRTAVRRRSLSRVSYTVGLLVLIGTVTALVVVVRVPAHSTTRPAAPPPPVPSAYGEPPAVDGGHLEPKGKRPGTGGGQRADAFSPSTGSEPPDGPATEARSLARAPGAGPGTPGDATETLHRSLVLSGLLGLIISLTGLVMVGSRRRMW
ncbi:hypothetical protein AB0H63_00500 [Micromonospora echinospora]|uniref:hypothetical protein n=1 Tax=Micromonospora echinospora TaxID=1877 RepID=UPI0033E856D2